MKVDYGFANIPINLTGDLTGRKTHHTTCTICIWLFDLLSRNLRSDVLKNKYIGGCAGVLGA